MEWRVYPPWGSSAHTGRIPGRHKNGEYAAVTRGRPAFQQHEAYAEGSDTTHNTKTTKSIDHSDMEALGFQLRDYYEEVK